METGKLSLHYLHLSVSYLCSPDTQAYLPSSFTKSFPSFLKNFNDFFINYEHFYIFPSFSSFQDTQEAKNQSDHVFYTCQPIRTCLGPRPPIRNQERYLHLKTANKGPEYHQTALACLEKVKKFIQSAERRIPPISQSAR